MQSEGHMEINIFGSDNTVFLGVLIKRRRLLNTLLLRAQLRKPLLLFILNSDELSRAARTPQLSLSPLQAGIGGERRKSIGDVRREVRMRGLPGWQALGPVALEQREVCPEEGQPFGPVREMNLFLLN